MHKNKYVVPFKIKNTNVLFNAFYGTLDIIEESTVFDNLVNNNISLIDPTIIPDLINRKYISKTHSDELLEIIKERKDLAHKKGKFYIVFSYTCNFKCPYCFEKNLKINDIMTPEKLNYIFHTIKFLIEKYNYEESEVILYGGEPLLNNNKDLINNTLLFCQQNNLNASIITNGSTISNYIDLINDFKDLINDISITIDGPKAFNDMRRIYKNNTGSYDDIITSLTLLNKYSINNSVRVNMDKSFNFSYSEFINKLYEDIGYKVKVKLFKVEDNKCSGDIEHLFSNSELIKTLNSKDLKSSIQKFNIVSCLKYPNHIKNLLENPNFTYPLIRYCQIGCLFTFDPSGEIFICPEATGDKNFSIGTFYPNRNIDITKLKSLFDYSIFTIPKCANCNLAPICGGGCPYESLNFNGDIYSPKCNYNDLYESIKTYIEKVFFD